MRGFVLYIPNTRVKIDYVLYVPSTRVKRSFVLDAPSTRVHESVTVSGVAFERGDFLWECTGSSGLTPKRGFT